MATPTVEDPVVIDDFLVQKELWFSSGELHRLIQRIQQSKTKWFVTPDMLPYCTILKEDPSLGRLDGKACFKVRRHRSVSTAALVVPYLVAYASDYLAVGRLWAFTAVGSRDVTHFFTL